MSLFPHTRLRRNRNSGWIRDLVCENNLCAHDLIQSFFIIEGNNTKQPIDSMPGIFRYSIDLLVEEAKKAEDLGIKAIMLFPNIENKYKNNDATESYNEQNLVCRAISELKNHIKIGVIADVALDPYTNHGHDGILINDYVDNDQTIEILKKQALSLAKSGCDMVAPSDMMDGRIIKIRKYLDENSFSNIGIMAYSAKYASGFYGPFRDAVGSSSNLKGASKSTYQMDYRNSNEALREIKMDVEEGADMIIIKPALSYLDIIYRAKSNFDLPIIAYQVSGEYSMFKAASLNNWLDFDKIMLESLISIKRAGANSIISYAAMDMLRII